LYLSIKLCQAAYKEKILIHGVTQTVGRGLPDAVIQKEEKSKSKQDEVHGTVRVAILWQNTNGPVILAASVYDTKPVHILLTIAENVEWIDIERLVWDKILQKYHKIKFKHLNLIHVYNLGMGMVDLADQLQNHYRCDHWMRKCKWWWAIFIWVIGVAQTNAYILYIKVCKARHVGKDRILSHKDFIKKLAFQLIWPDKYIPWLQRKHKTVGSIVQHSGAGARAKNARTDAKREERCYSITK
jgi:hypothetical protein